MQRLKRSFILRFDDICPTMNWDIWREVEATLCDLEIKPMLAVIPDCKDPTLRVGLPEANFWSIVRDWQSRGFSIGLHGYEHLYLTTECGLMGINKYSEFAGLDEQLQLAKIRKALGIFERASVRADCWVAPAHSFDGVTVDVLQRCGIRVISDGYSLYPYRDVNGMLWVPQQCESFSNIPVGVWTVCMHHNNWSRRDVAEFRRRVIRHRSEITTLSEIVKSYGARDRAIADRLFYYGFGAVAKMKRALWRNRKSHS